MATEKQKKFVWFKTKDNASKYHWDRMTKAEKEWLFAFELSEFDTEQGHIAEAVDALIGVGVVPSDKYVDSMRERRISGMNCNPQRAENMAGTDSKRNKTSDKRNTRNNYDSGDFVRVMPGKILKDDLGFTAVYSTTEALESVEGSADHVEGHLADKVYKPFKIEAGLNPDETAVMINPEDGMIEAIDHAAKKNRSLEKLIEDAKLSKEAKENLLNITQKFTYEAMVYTMHGTQYMNLNYILKGVNGVLMVQDQHDRIQTLELYLKRCTEDSFATHVEIYHPDGTKETWVYKKGPRANIEGKAVKYEAL